MILVTGATGNIGGEAVRQLVARGRRVRALTRRAEKLATLQSESGGFEVAEGDFMKPETLGSALAGVERVLLAAGARDVAAATANVLAAARASGSSLRHVVLLSSATIAIDPPTTIGRWHLAAEEHLKASGLAWTMLRPGNFASNAARWAGMIKSQGAVFAVAGGKSAPIDPRDIASVGVRALVEPGHEGATHVLSGEQVLTPTEQVERIGAAIGRSLRFVAVPEAGARAGMMKSGMDAELADAVLELIVAGREDRPGAGIVTTTVREVTGAAPRSFDEWARDNAAIFQ